MNDIIEDLFKIYMSCIDSYNSKIHQTINNKYTIIDKSMIAIYLYVKIIEDRKEDKEEATKVLSNYLLKQVIYSETGNLAFEISDKSKINIYNEILDKLIIEKFEYKNRIMKKLKYNYENIKINKYSELLMFLEDIAEFVIIQKVTLDKEEVTFLNKIKNKIINQSKTLKVDDYFYKEKKMLIDLIKDNKFSQSKYGNLINVALNLKDVYRYSHVTIQIPENVLFHQFTITVASLILAQYCNKEFGDNIDIYTILTKSLFHDFSEYKGTEIISSFKYYNDITKKMFAEIEENDEKELKEKIGKNLYIIISEYKNGKEGLISEIIDKMFGIMKLWIEVEYFNNYTFIKPIDAIYQDRFKKFLKIEKMDELKNKKFYLDLLRESYIYIKEHLIEKDLEIFLKYFTKDELEKYREEIKLLKENPESFLK